MSTRDAQPWQPLAARLRPASLDEYVGQTHLLARGRTVRFRSSAQRTPRVHQFPDQCIAHRRGEIGVRLAPQAPAHDQVSAIRCRELRHAVVAVRRGDAPSVGSAQCGDGVCAATCFTEREGVRDEDR